LSGLEALAVKGYMREMEGDGGDGRCRGDSKRS